MALSTKLELRQGQQLVMTPQLQQAIRLLQLSNIELMQYVETELERNPLLEADEGGGEAAVRTESETAEFAKSEEAPAAPADESWLDLAKPVADPEATFDTDYDNVYPDAAPADQSGG
jgi:RNA polymerase sigma-54 factor